MGNVTVLVVDDSALMRKMLTEILNRCPTIEVVGTAADPYAAREKIRKLNPDVLTLDIEMPRMDGITFLRNLMRLRPMPVVMVSTLTERGADITFEALQVGAVDFVTKPKVDAVEGLEEQADQIVSKVLAAAKANVRPKPEEPSSAPPPAERPRPTLGRAPVLSSDRLIAVGASTGGTEAIYEFLKPFTVNTPPIVIVQHIPPMFSASFARRLDSLCELTVVELAESGVSLESGTAYIAPGGAHMVIERTAGGYKAHLDRGPPVNRHRPSVDVLFQSVAEHAGRRAVGVILTGMGDDGARGMLEMRNQGSINYAQDEASSVVWGMPGEAVKLDAAQHVAPLSKLSAMVIAEVSRRHSTRPLAQRSETPSTDAP